VRRSCEMSLRVAYYLSQVVAFAAPFEVFPLGWGE
jgi:hypothetical protein